MHPLELAAFNLLSAQAGGARVNWDTLEIEAPSGG